MKTMYVVSVYYGKPGAKIATVEVERETDSFIWVKGDKHRRKIRSNWGNYFNSWKEAHEFILVKVLTKLEQAQKELKQAENIYNEIMRMKQ